MDNSKINKQNKQTIQNLQRFPISQTRNWLSTWTGDTSSDLDLVNRKPKNDSYWISYANFPRYPLAFLYFKVFNHSEMGNFNGGHFELHWSNSLFIEVFIADMPQLS